MVFLTLNMLENVNEINNFIEIVKGSGFQESRFKCLSLWESKRFAFMCLSLLFHEVYLRRVRVWKGSY